MARKSYRSGPKNAQSLATIPRNTSSENGYELIRKIRSLEPEAGGHIPAIALTAYASVADRRRALLAGFPTQLTVILSLTYQQDLGLWGKA
ncbi:MAG TPA: hypothetical protein VE980_01545 [Pyrinomonadaceae bacterium]|nr:hypothetical protein [Pyrinomonadaceae bacterium]